VAKYKIKEKIMKILVVGSGGREHAIIWSLSKNPKISKIYCASGNAGISELAECILIAPTEIEKLVEFAKEHEIDLTVVGMDDPLVLGIVDAFEKENLRIFGPNKVAAQLEGSKAFSKELMKKYKIPTANYQTFDDIEFASTYIKELTPPIVVKVDGLALGKGVYICQSAKEAEQALKEIMQDKKFGASGNKVVIEEFLVGEEVSILSFCDGKTVVPMVSSKDHKKAYDHDKGPNTGGMGTISPSKIYTQEVAKECMEKIFIPTVDALNKEGITFKGIIYFGLIITKDGPKVIEYNARFGDPEAQVVLTRLDTDLLEIIESCIDGRLDKMNIKWKDHAAVCLVLASGGYPNTYAKGYEITGLDNIDKNSTIVFHAGTKKEGDKIVTNGGRVLGVTSIGENLEQARTIAYKMADKIHFTDKQFRTDIGK
jgi:phosphoribosylamine--glycine ligase